MPKPNNITDLKSPPAPVPPPPTVATPATPPTNDETTNQTETAGTDAATVPPVASAAAEATTHWHVSVLNSPHFPARVVVTPSGADEFVITTAYRENLGVWALSQPCQMRPATPEEIAEYNAKG